MGNTTAVKESAPEPQTSQDAEGLGKMYVPPAFKSKRSHCFMFIKISYVIISILNILLSIALIAVAVSAAIAMKIFYSEHSGRLGALILLAVTSAIAISVTIYSMISVLRNHSKHVHSASVLLFILAVILSIIVATSMRISEEYEVKLSQSLSESFRLVREDSPRQVKVWAAIQSDLRCCGVYSPDDYRTENLPNAFSPDVPISCCPAYDSDRSELVQERERQACRAKALYHISGCKIPVIDLFREMTRRVVSISVVVIIFMVWLSIHGSIWICCLKNRVRESVASSLKTSIPELFSKPQTSSKT